jgi:hypothetical protein
MLEGLRPRELGHFGRRYSADAYCGQTLSVQRILSRSHSVGGVVQERGQLTMASEQTINTIAKALGEADEGPLAQIKAVVDNLGEQACLTLLAETEKIEKAGGLMRGDGSGRRSPGGVFFFLARQRLPRDIRAAIFNDKKPRDPRAPGSSPPEPKQAKPGASAVVPSALPRRRVFEVVPASKPPPPPAYSPAPAAVAAPPRSAPRGEWPPTVPDGAFIPPELPAAVVRAKAKQGAQAAFASLNPTDQYLLLVELLGELHAQHGGEPPRSVAVDVPRSERKPTSLSQPPPAQEEPEEAEAEVEEPKRRVSRAKAARPKAAATKSRSRA